MAFEQVGIEAVIRGVPAFQSGAKQVEAATQHMTQTVKQQGVSFVDAVIKVGQFERGLSAIPNVMGSAIGAAKSLSSTLGFGLNSTMEQASAQINAFTKDGVKTAEILEMIKVRAAKTPFEFKEMATAAGALMPAAKQANVSLESIIETAEILAASNPAQGLEGAAFSIREAVSGDFTSAIERFNLPRSEINKLKKEGVPSLEILTRTMQAMGYDASLVANMASTMTGRWSTVKDTFDSVRISLTKPIFDLVKKGLENLQPLLDANIEKVLKFATAIGTGAVNIIMKGVDLIKAGLTNLGQFIASAMGIQNIGEGFTAWGQIVQTVFNNVKGAVTDFVSGFTNGIDMVGSVANTLGATLRVIFAEVVSIIKGVSGQLQEDSGLTKFFTNIAMAIGISSKETGGLVKTLLALGKAYFGLLLDTWAQIFKNIGAAAMWLWQNAIKPLAGGIADLGQFFLKASDGMEKGSINMKAVAIILGNILTAWLALQAAKKVWSVVQDVKRTGQAFIDNLKDIKNTITQTIKTVGEIISKVADVFSNIFQKVVRTGDALIDKLEDITQTITQKIVTVSPPEDILKNIGIKSGTSFAGGIAQGMGIALGILVAPVIGAAILAALPAVLIAAGVLAAVFVVGLIAAFPRESGQIAATIAGLFIKANIEAIKLTATAVKLIAFEIPKAILEGIIDSNIGPEIGAFFTAVFKGDIGGAIKAGGAIIKSLFAEILGEVLDTIRDRMSKVAEHFKIPDALEAIKGALGGIKDWAANWGTEFVAGFRAKFFEVSGISSEEFNKVTGVISGALETATSAAATGAAAVVEAIKNPLATASAVGGAIWQAALNIAGAIMDGLGDLWTMGWNAAKNLAGGIIEGLKNAPKAAITAGVEWLLDIPGRSPIEEAYGEIGVEAGTNLVNGIAGSISAHSPEALEAMEKMTSAIAGIIDNVISAGKSLGGLGAGGIQLPGLKSLRDAVVESVQIFAQDVTEASVHVAKLAGEFAENASKITGTFKSGIENFAALADFTPVLTSVLKPLRDAFNDVVLVFGQDVQDVSLHAASMTASFVESAGTIVGNIKSGIENLNALEGYKTILRSNLVNFSADFIFAANEFNKQIEDANDQIGEGATEWASAASTLVGVISGGATTFAGLKTYSTLVRVNFQAFIKDYIYAANEFATAITTRGMVIEESVIAWADGASKIVGLISGGVSNMNSLKDMRPLLEDNLLTFARGLIEVATVFQGELIKAGTVIEESTVNFAEGAGSIVELIGNAIGPLSSLPGIGDNAKKNVTVLIGLLSQAISDFVRGTKHLATENLEAQKNISEVGMNIVESLATLAAFVSKGVSAGDWTRTQLIKLTSALVAAVKEFATGVKGISIDAANAANILSQVAKNLIESFIQLSSVTGYVDVSAFSSFVRQVITVVSEISNLAAGILPADIQRLHMVADAIRALIGAVGGGGGMAGGGMGTGGAGGVGVNGTGVFSRMMPDWNAPPGWVAVSGLEQDANGVASIRYHLPGTNQYGSVTETPQGFFFITAPPGAGGYIPPGQGPGAGITSQPTPMDDILGSPLPPADWQDRMAAALAPYIPNFAGGGWMDAGAGALAVLHGREAVVPMNSIPWRTGDVIPEGWMVDPSSWGQLPHRSRGAGGQLIHRDVTLTGNLIPKPVEAPKPGRAPNMPVGQINVGPFVITFNITGGNAVETGKEVERTLDQYFDSQRLRGVLLCQ